MIVSIYRPAAPNELHVQDGLDEASISHYILYWQNIVIWMPRGEIKAVQFFPDKERFA